MKRCRSGRTVSSPLPRTDSQPQAGSWGRRGEEPACEGAARLEPCCVRAGCVQRVHDEGQSLRLLPVSDEDPCWWLQVRPRELGPDQHGCPAPVPYLPVVPLRLRDLPRSACPGHPILFRDHVVEAVLSVCSRAGSEVASLTAGSVRAQAPPSGLPRTCARAGFRQTGGSPCGTCALSVSRVWPRTWLCPGCSAVFVLLVFSGPPISGSRRRTRPTLSRPGAVPVFCLSLTGLRVPFRDSCPAG